MLQLQVTWDPLPPLQLNQSWRWLKRYRTYLNQSERVSHKNTGADISNWIKHVVTDASAVTKGLFGTSTSICPNLFTFDCAIELLYGGVLGFRSDHQVDNPKMYANCVMYILLNHEKLLMKNPGDQKSIAIATSSYRKLLDVCIFAAKQCDSHIYRAMTQHIKNTPRKKTLRSDDHVSRTVREDSNALVYGDSKNSIID